MPELEKEPGRREFLRKTFLNLVFIGAGLGTGRMITAEELQRQTNFQLDQAEKIIRDALEYASRVEKYDERLKALLPKVIIRAYLPGENTPFALSAFTISKPA